MATNKQRPAGDQGNEEPEAQTKQAEAQAQPDFSETVKQRLADLDARIAKKGAVTMADASEMKRLRALQKGV